MANRIKPIKGGLNEINTLVADPTKKTVVVPVHAVVVSGSDGPKTFVQKFQSSYKALAAFISTLTTLATQIQTLTPFLPDNYRVEIGVGVAVLGTIGTFLTTNAKFVESL